MSASLSELNILALDCQATGANPQKGHLLELGWMSACASLQGKSPASGVQAYLNRLPRDEKIPPAVSRITGISDDSLRAAKTPKIIWQHLMAAVKTVISENQLAVCPTVIHFARFEKPFLRELHRDIDPESPFPFQIICTHEIAVRLLPDLPRRGLRALAGYFGHSMPEFKRSADHVVATAFIWKKLIEMLNLNLGIDTLDQLSDWLASTEPAGRTSRIFPMAPEKRRHLPDKPGIYRILRTNGDLLYIGKAKSLKKRVNSYFRPKAPHAEHTLEMLTQAQKLDFTLTGSALEAAMQESDEIKRHSPPYNIALRSRQRKLTFCTKDLSRHARVADEDYTIGPLPDGKFIAAVSAMGHWITDGHRSADQELLSIGCTLMGLSPEYAPDITCLKEGFDIFREDHRDPLKNQSPLRLLTGLGATLWRRRMEAAEADEAAEENTSDNDNDELPQNGSNDTRLWTPESVARSIEHMVLHNAHLIRRARWFCLLSESSLAWESANRSDQLKTLVVFEGGSVFKRDDIESAAKVPVPPGFDKSFRRRQKQFSLMTYDRLRILTTELRRLISENRNIELRLGPMVTLGYEELKKALRWV
jgi:DNA polymerase-3 subunit epsilon